MHWNLNFQLIGNPSHHTNTAYPTHCQPIEFACRQSDKCRQKALSNYTIWSGYLSLFISPTRCSPPTHVVWVSIDFWECVKQCNRKISYLYATCFRGFSPTDAICARSHICMLLIRLRIWSLCVCVCVLYCVFTEGIYAAVYVSQHHTKW